MEVEATATDLFEYLEIYNISSTPNGSTIFMADSVNTTADSLDCPDYLAWQIKFLDFFAFWIEGVLNCVIAGTGLIANVVSAYILSRYVFQLQGIHFLFQLYKMTHIAGEIHTEREFSSLRVF